MFFFSFINEKKEKKESPSSSICDLRFFKCEKTSFFFFGLSMYGIVGFAKYGAGHGLPAVLAPVDVDI